MTLLEKMRCRQQLAVIASVALCLLLACAGFCQDADKPAGDAEITVAEGDVWRVYDAQMTEVSRVTVKGMDPAGKIQYEVAAPADAEPNSKMGSAEDVADAVKREIKKGERATKGYFLDHFGSQFAVTQTVLAEDVTAPAEAAEDDSRGAEGPGGPGAGPGGPGGPGAGPGGPGGPGAGPGGPGGPGAGPGGPGGPGAGPGGPPAAGGAPGDAAGGEAPAGEAKAGPPMLLIAGGAVVVLVVVAVLVLSLKKKKSVVGD